VAISLQVGDEDLREIFSKRIVKVILLYFGKEATKLVCIHFTEEHMCNFILDKVPSHQLPHFVFDKVFERSVSLQFNVDWYSPSKELPLEK
jgi:hypothetical protein